MREKELLAKIKELRQIQPRKDWVVLTKEQILGEEMPDLTKQEVSPLLVFKWIFHYKLAFAGIAVLLILVGSFGFAQKSLPGDLLYSIKRATEKVQASFVSEAEKPKAQLKLVSKRLEELARIAENNQTQKLASAINEFQRSAAKAVQNLKEKKPQRISEEIVQQTKEIEEKKKELKKVYGVAGLEENEEANPAKVLVEWLIEDLENIPLSEEDQGVLNEAKEDYEEGDYSEALEKLLSLNQ